MKFTAPGLFPYEIDFPLLRNSGNEDLFTLALLYTLEVKNDYFQVVAICRGLDFPLGKTKE